MNKLMKFTDVIVTAIEQVRSLSSDDIALIHYDGNLWLTAGNRWIRAWLRLPGIQTTDVPETVIPKYTFWEGLSAILRNPINPSHEIDVEYQKGKFVGKTLNLRIESDSVSHVPKDCELLPRGTKDLAYISGEYLLQLLRKTQHFIGASFFSKPTGVYFDIESQTVQAANENLAIFCSLSSPDFTPLNAGSFAIRHESILDFLGPFSKVVEGKKFLLSEDDLKKNIILSSKGLVIRLAAASVEHTDPVDWQQLIRNYQARATIQVNKEDLLSVVLTFSATVPDPVCIEYSDKGLHITEQSDRFGVTMQATVPAQVQGRGTFSTIPWDLQCLLENLESTQLTLQIQGTEYDCVSVLLTESNNEYRLLKGCGCALKEE